MGILIIKSGNMGSAGEGVRLLMEQGLDRFVFYHYGGNKEDQEIVGILEESGFRFNAVDVKEKKLSSYLSRDIGADSLPLMLTPDGLQEGYARILEYICAAVIKKKKD